MSESKEFFWRECCNCHTEAQVTLYEVRCSHCGGFLEARVSKETKLIQELRENFEGLESVLRNLTDRIEELEAQNGRE